MAECRYPLGERARARRDAMLPGLLAAVRWRRRRHRAARAGAVVLLFGLVALWRWPGGEPTGAPTAPAVTPSIAAPIAASAWQRVPNVPDIVARCSVATTARAEWFVDDHELQRLLRDDDRPSGLVRTRGEVLVSAAAIDPFPTLAP